MSTATIENQIVLAAQSQCYQVLRSTITQTEHAFPSHSVLLPCCIRCKLATPTRCAELPLWACCHSAAASSLLAECPPRCAVYCTSQARVAAGSSITARCWTTPLLTVISGSGHTTQCTSIRSHAAYACAHALFRNALGCAEPACNVTHQSNTSMAINLDVSASHAGRVLSMSIGGTELTKPGTVDAAHAHMAAQLLACHHSDKG